MKSLKLLVVADEQTIAMFSLLGAHGMVMTDPTSLKDLYDHLELKGHLYGGILLAGSLYEEASRYLKRIQNFGIPLIFLPSSESGADAGRLALEALTERAMGMKLSLE